MLVDVNTHGARQSVSSTHTQPTADFEAPESEGRRIAIHTGAGLA